MFINDLTVALDILISLGLLAAILYFVFVLTLAVSRRKTVVEGPRCERCASGLIPLLDASYIFHGEAACGRCGTLHEGIDWPADERRPVARLPASRGSSRGSRPHS